MKQLKALYDALEKEEKLHKDDIYNYAVPRSWNLYGYPHVKTIRSKEILVNPYSFYLFTLRHIVKDENNGFKKPLPFVDSTASKGNWLKKSSIYSLMIRCASSWDHDRDDVIMHDNMYHLRDNGTFLKSMIILPYLKRMGINTILLHQIFTLGKSNSAHTYPVKEALQSFTEIDETLADPLIANMEAKDQCAAFIEACHLLGIRVILEYCPGKLARDNCYIKEHPEWFYWIHTDALAHYHAPLSNGLPQNTIPHTYTLKDFYKSEDTIQHLLQFQQAPSDTAIDLTQIEAIHQRSVAPYISDQINANLPCDMDSTVFRFFEDKHSHMPKDIATTYPPFLSQDTMRCDLHPGKKPMASLWAMLNENISWYLDVLSVDGFFIEKPYLLPEKLQKELVKTARKQNKKCAMIAEETTLENSEAWIRKGYDAISGNSGYEESNIWDYKFHNFAYRLKGNACPTFAASEFYDSRRVSSLPNGKRLATLLSIMNHFLPNGIPMLMNGIECFEVQPMQLSEYGDQKYLYSLPKEDPRYLHQAYIDSFYFDYCTSDLSVLPSLLEHCHKLRSEYLDAICNPSTCIPVWFNSPKDFGIGFTFIKEDKALMVVCNSNINDACNLHIHTENLYSELPFVVSAVRQIFSSEDPYLHDIAQDAFRNLHADFVPGEVKFIEFQS